MRRAYAFSAPYCIEFLLTIREGKHIMLFYLLGREGSAEVKMLRKLKKLLVGQHGHNRVDSKSYRSVCRAKGDFS